MGKKLRSYFMAIKKARYKGFLLNANCRSNENVLLWGTDKNLINEGFQEDLSDTPVTYDKIVTKSELEELYEEREFATWNGMEFELDGGAPKGWYTIWYSTYNYRKDAEMIKKIESLGMKIVEPGLWRIEVPKKSLSNYHIVKEDLLHK